MHSVLMTIFHGGKTIIPAMGLGLMLFAASAPAGDSARAQDEDTESELLACDSIEDEAERIQCFNDLVERLRTQGGSAPSPAPAERNAPAGAGALPEVTAPGRERPAAPAPVDADPHENFGFPESNAERERMTAHITRWERDPVGKIVFWLDNGQIWKETKSSDFPLHGEADRAVIYESWMSGYRLEVDGFHGFARVRRIR